MDGEYTSARRRPGRRARGGRTAPGAARQEDAGQEDGWPEGIGRGGAGRGDAGQKEESRDPESRAREICLQQLTLAPKTRTQLGDALRKKGIPGEVADMVLGRFTEAGLIDDAAFARAWVESRHYSKGLAGRALSAELRRRGVDDDEIREAVATLDPEAEVETARRLVQQKLASTRGQPSQTRTRKLAGMLARKGYPAGLAFRVIREALEAEGAEAELEDDIPDDPVDDDFDRYTE